MDLKSIQTAYLAGTPVNDICKEHKIRPVELASLAKQHNWMYNSEAQLTRKFNEQLTALNEIKQTTELQKSELESDAKSRVEIIKKHRDDTTTIRFKLTQGIYTEDMQLIKMSKLALESVKLLHEMERQAWQINELESNYNDMASLSTSELQKLLADMSKSSKTKPEVRHVIEISNHKDSSL